MAKSLGWLLLIVGAFMLLAAPRLPALHGWYAWAAAGIGFLAIFLGGLLAWREK